MDGPVALLLDLDGGIGRLGAMLARMAIVVEDPQTRLQNVMEES